MCWVWCSFSDHFVSRALSSKSIQNTTRDYLQLTKTRVFLQLYKLGNVIELKFKNNKKSRNLRKRMKKFFLGSSELELMEGWTHPFWMNKVDYLCYSIFRLHIWFFNVFNFSFLLKLGKFSCTLNQCIIVIWLCSTWASFASLKNVLPSSVSDKQASEEFLSAYMGWTSVSVPLCFSLDFFAKKLMQISNPSFHKSILDWEYFLLEYIIWVNW